MASVTVAHCASHAWPAQHSREGSDISQCQIFKDEQFCLQNCSYFIYLRIFAGGFRSEILHLRKQYLQDLELDQIDSRKWEQGLVWVIIKT